MSQFPTFDPFRSITPAAGLSDFYRQPLLREVPDTGLGQVAEALQGLSPTLNTFIGRQADAANQAQATQGQIDAERLNAEQARDVSRGNFVNLERDGVIPVGASPFRLAAMQQEVGRKSIETGLRDTLNQNIQKFSDPFNNEDPAEFVQQHPERTLKLQAVRPLTSMSWLSTRTLRQPPPFSCTAVSLERRKSSH